MLKKYHRALDKINGEFKERECVESMCQTMNALGTILSTWVRHLNHFLMWQWTQTLVDKQVKINDYQKNIKIKK